MTLSYLTSEWPNHSQVTTKEQATQGFITKFCTNQTPIQLTHLNRLYSIRLNKHFICFIKETSPENKMHPKHLVSRKNKRKTHLTFNNKRKNESEVTLDESSFQTTAKLQQGIYLQCFNTKLRYSNIFPVYCNNYIRQTVQTTIPYSICFIHMIHRSHMESSPTTKNN